MLASFSKQLNLCMSSWIIISNWLIMSFRNYYFILKQAEDAWAGFDLS